MYISAFPHRDELFEITNRWLSDQLEEADPIRITRIITYDSFIAWETIQDFIGRLIPLLFEGAVFLRPIATKKELKDFLCRSGHRRTTRIEALINDYLRTPEYYYNSSPIAGLIYHDERDRILSMCRFKRIKRTAEKASRYASEFIHREVMAAAHPSLSKRLPAEVLEDPGVMADLVRAEKKVMEQIRENGLRLPVEIMTIRDVLGMKIVMDPPDEAELETAVLSLPGIEIVEKERHTGMYNAVHYIVDVPVDYSKLQKKFNSVAPAMNLSLRGLPVSGITDDFLAFGATGYPAIQIDLIVTTYKELVESEIGRSMHEKRIFDQRQQQRFYGNIPKNIEYIIEYLLAVGLSPAVHIDEIPIKIWGRYLPDTLGFSVRQLFNMPEYSLIDT
ncbi:MAG: hypothetical protein ACOZF0_14780 [Thermodesulfobacteriota bacterium]